MSHVSLSSGPDTEHGALENPYAVWLRNVPTWLDEDRYTNFTSVTRLSVYL